MSFSVSVHRLMNRPANFYIHDRALQHILSIAGRERGGGMKRLSTWFGVLALAVLSLGMVGAGTAFAALSGTGNTCGSTAQTAVANGTTFECDYHTTATINS